MPRKLGIAFAAEGDGFNKTREKGTRMQRPKQEKMLWRYVRFRYDGIVFVKSKTASLAERPLTKANPET
jgi:hypothetical protein